MTEWIDDYNIDAYSFIIHNKQNFHLKNTYSYIHDWLMDEGFQGINIDTNTGDCVEYYYQEGRPAPGKRELRAWWRMVMDTPEGESKFYRYRVNLDFFVFNITKTDIMFQGKKTKADNAEMIFTVKGILELDYNKRWRNHPILSKLYPFFSKRVFKDIREGHEEELRRRMMRFQEEVKKILNLQQFDTYEKRIQEDRGL
jgi:hypothetical protein